MAKPKVAKTSTVVNDARPNGKAFKQNNRGGNSFVGMYDKLGHNLWGRTKPSGATIGGHMIPKGILDSEARGLVIMKIRDSRDTLRRKELRRLRRERAVCQPGPSFKSPSGVFQMMDILPDETKVKMAQLRASLV